ncbi:MAG: hypothetical protein ABEJ72_00995 [Candidatus Aenigmatarchaeota archaeon]
MLVDHPYLPEKLAADSSQYTLDEMVKYIRDERKRNGYTSEGELGDPHNIYMEEGILLDQILQELPPTNNDLGMKIEFAENTDRYPQDPGSLVEEGLNELDATREDFDCSPAQLRVDAVGDFELYETGYTQFLVFPDSDPSVERHIVEIDEENGFLEAYDVVYDEGSGEVLAAKEVKMQGERKSGFWNLAINHPLQVWETVDSPGSHGFQVDSDSTPASLVNCDDKTGVEELLEEM